MATPRPFPRRALLAAAAALPLAACTDSVECPIASPSPTPAASSSPAATPFKAATTSQTPAPPTSPAPVHPTRAQLVAKYGKQTPRHWGLETSGVVLRQKSTHVCLTFDACGGPYGSKVDTDLIELSLGT